MNTTFFYSSCYFGGGYELPLDLLVLLQKMKHFEETQIMEVSVLHKACYTVKFL